MNKNPCIRCDVTSCKHNVNSDRCCSLNVIKVGTHEPHPTQCQCVDCESFECKPNCNC